MGIFDFFKNFKAPEERQTVQIYDEICDKAYNPQIKDDDLSLLTQDERIFFVVYTFNMEVLNGGLCQFFVNSSRAYAPLISEYLQAVGALSQKQLFDNFIKTNNINLNDLSAFKISSSEEWGEKLKLYPFDDFDDNFEELDDILEKFAISKGL